MKTIKAVITHVSAKHGHGYAEAEDGRNVFINQRYMPRGIETVGTEIEVGVVERYEAMRLRVIDLAPSVPAMKIIPPAAKPMAPAPAPVPLQELPSAVAKILSEPIRKTMTKADRLSS